MEALFARYLEIRPLFLPFALPMNDVLKMIPYFGVLPVFAFRALCERFVSVGIFTEVVNYEGGKGGLAYRNRAFSAPRICTVDAGYLARLVREPA